MLSIIHENSRFHPTVFKLLTADLICLGCKSNLELKQDSISGYYTCKNVNCDFSTYTESRPDSLVRESYHMILIKSFIDNRDLSFCADFNENCLSIYDYGEALEKRRQGKNRSFASLQNYVNITMPQSMLFSKEYFESRYKVWQLL